MDFLNLIGALSGSASIGALLATIIRLGEWKARQEERMLSHGKRIDAIEHRQDAEALLLNKNNELLAEIKVKLDLMYTQKDKKGKQ